MKPLGNKTGQWTKYVAMGNNFGEVENITDYKNDKEDGLYNEYFEFDTRSDSTDLPSSLRKLALAISKLPLEIRKLALAFRKLPLAFSVFVLATRKLPLAFSFLALATRKLPLAFSVSVLAFRIQPIELRKLKLTISN